VVGVLVALVLVVVAFTSITGDDEGGQTTASTDEDDATVEDVCRENRTTLEALFGQLAGLSTQAGASQSAEELQALAVEAEQISAGLIDLLEKARAELGALEVPVEQGPALDRLDAALGELIFASATFISRSIEVLATGDPAAVRAFGPEAQMMASQLAELEQVQATEALALDAPSCALQSGTGTTAGAAPPS